MLSLLIVFLSLGLIVGIHELCHMLTAKAFGIKVLRFSFGFGPKLLGYTFKNTSYELRLLPLGGFVQFKGEDPTVKVQGGFFSVSWYKRSLVALAGPLANLILGFLIIFILLLTKHWSMLETIKRTFEISLIVITETLKWLGGLVHSTSHASDLSGPITITKTMVTSLKASISQFFLLLSVVSLSIGLFNLFPIPGLDGGHVALYVLEAIKGKPLSTKIYEIWNIVGLVLLSVLMSYIIFTDLVKLWK